MSLQTEIKKIAEKSKELESLVSVELQCVRCKKLWFGNSLAIAKDIRQPLCNECTSHDESDHDCGTPDGDGCGVCVSRDPREE